MDCGDIISDKPVNESFKNKIQSIQYIAWVAITEIIQVTSSFINKLYIPK